MRNLLGIFVAGVLYFDARLPPDQRLLREADRVRALHPRRRRRLPGAVLGGLRRRRQPRAAGPRSATRGSAAPRVAARRLAAGRSPARSRCSTCSSSAARRGRSRSSRATQASSSFGDGQIAAYAPRLPEIAARPGRRRASRCLITVVGVRVLPFAPEDDAAPARAGAAGDRLMAARTARAGCWSPRRTSRRARRRSPSACAARCATRGLAVQAFKKGPDYIDPMWLTAATRPPLPQPRSLPVGRRPSIAARSGATRPAADVCARRGQQGPLRRPRARRQQQQRGAGEGARPAGVLVIDARGMTRGIAPLILGYQAFDRDVRIAGVILNNLGGSRHEAKLRVVIEHYTDVRVLGAVHCDPRLAIVERHLGLMPSNEADGAGAARRRDRRDRRRGRSTSTRVLRIAADAPPLAVPGDAVADPCPPAAAPDLRIGVAQDRAFGFYYADDLDALRAAGATLVRFDTLTRRAAARASTGCSSAAAFPELFARRARGERGAAQRGSARAIDAGLPVYAECGGLMYLARTLTQQGPDVPDGRRDSRRRRDARAAGRARLRRTSRRPRRFPWPAADGRERRGARARVPLFEPREPARRRCATPTRSSAATASTGERDGIVVQQRARVVRAPAQRRRQRLGGALRRLRPARRLPRAAPGQHRLPAAGARPGGDGHLTARRPTRR